MHMYVCMYVCTYCNHNLCLSLLSLTLSTAVEHSKTRIPCVRIHVCVYIHDCIHTKTHRHIETDAHSDAKPRLNNKRGPRLSVPCVPYQPHVHRTFSFFLSVSVSVSISASVSNSVLMSVSFSVSVSVCLLH